MNKEDTHAGFNCFPDSLGCNRQILNVFNLHAMGLIHTDMHWELVTAAKLSYSSGHIVTSMYV